MQFPEGLEDSPFRGTSPQYRYRTSALIYMYIFSFILAFSLIPHPVVVNLMLQDALRITSYKKMKTKKRKKGRKKKDTPKNEFIIEENHQQFSRIFTNNVVAKKMKVKKNFEKKILNKKRKTL